jgi:hypothetical protein
LLQLRWLLLLLLLLNVIPIKYLAKLKTHLFTQSYPNESQLLSSPSH